MMITRRSLLGVMLAASAGPAIVRVASLMPVNRIVWHAPAVRLTAEELRAMMFREEFIREFEKKVSLLRQAVTGSEVSSYWLDAA